ncbi:hypothetical protein PI125_g24656 [Phytophthora idaei]|nr:hypothetical protein PI125_g24656 [Phytophthora idaei]
MSDGSTRGVFIQRAHAYLKQPTARGPRPATLFAYIAEHFYPTAGYTAGAGEFQEDGTPPACRFFVST